MATGANEYNKNYGHQWTSPNTTNTYIGGPGEHRYVYPNHKEDMKHAKKLKPLPKIETVEFGKAFEVSTLLIATDNNAVKTAYNLALDDYFKTKQENFPSWVGLPEIKVQPSSDSLQRICRIAWYAEVPKIFVLDKEQIEEDKLWES